FSPLLRPRPGVANLSIYGDRCLALREGEGGEGGSRGRQPRQFARRLQKFFARLSPRRSAAHEHGITATQRQLSASSVVGGPQLNRALVQNLGLVPIELLQPGVPAFAVRLENCVRRSGVRGLG